MATVCGFSFERLLSGDCGTVDGDLILDLLSTSATTGLQSSHLGRGREMIQSILRKRKNSASARDADAMPQDSNKVVLSYTSNLISSGLREIFAHLVKHKLVDAIVTTAGGVEEDVIKCLGPTVIGDFAMPGKDLRLRGLNRIGNLLVPNDNYCAFEDFFVPVIEEMHKRQRASRWANEDTTPSALIRSIGAAMESLEKKEESVVFWCYRNQIPMFCPALTDGSMGDMIYFYNFSKKGFVVNPMPDVDCLARCCGRDDSVAAIVLGGGLPKHHLLRSLRHVERPKQVLMITTGLEVDGCTSSCTVSDDIAEGLLRNTDNVVRIHGDASLLFPLLL